MKSDLYYALLALDAYNRGPVASNKKLLVTGNKLGEFTFVDKEDAVLTNTSTQLFDRAVGRSERARVLIACSVFVPAKSDAAGASSSDFAGMFSAPTRRGRLTPTFAD